jgi:hypothetical protein
VEGVVNFNASVHVYTTVFAGVALNHCFVVYDVEFFVSGRDGEGGAGDYADDAEDCGGGFPAFGAAAGVVVGDVWAEGDGYGRGFAVAVEGSAGKRGGAWCDAGVDEGV